MEKYHYSWETPFEKMDFVSSANDVKECYWAQASIEFPRNKRTDNIGNILPREERININDVPIILIKDSKEESFLIIISSYKPDVFRVNKLIGIDDVQGINVSDCIPNEFFVWMYYCYNRHEKILDDLNLNNIVGFTGIIDDDTNKITGSSNSTSNLLITKAFVSNGYDLKSLIFDLSDSALTTVTAINEDRSLILDLNETELSFDSLSEGSRDQKMVRSIAYIYSSLLPALIKKYDSEKPSFVSQNKNFSKEIGIEVVQSIIDHNGINKNELSFDS